MADLEMTGPPVPGGTRLYCQGCGYSFVDVPTNANPFPRCCPTCGGACWSNTRRGWVVAAMERMTPVLNAGACVPAPGANIIVFDFTAAAVSPFSLDLTPGAPRAGAFSSCTVPSW